MYLAGIIVCMSHPQAYYDAETWRAKFPGTLSQGPRVVKQNRGSQVHAHIHVHMSVT